MSYKLSLPAEFLGKTGHREN